jgi:thioesterase domain-containing protein/acyl carrier protein
MPLTPNGKIDRKALPAPERTISEEREDYASPQTETEKKLVSIWSELLATDNIGINDNFFDLGGHSLLAIRMFASIENQFHKSIPLATLFEAGTIAELAAIIDMEEWTEPETCLVPIQPGGHKIPLYCVHAVGGNVLFYSDLAKYMPRDQPIIGIQARRLAGRQVGHGTIEEMAAHYVDEIIDRQPNGPYNVAGSSFGGLVAYEMARMLRARGCEVGLLALFDTSTPEYKQTLIPGTTEFQIKLHKLIYRAEYHFDNLKVLDMKGRGRYIKQKAQKGLNKYRRSFRNAFKKLVRSYYTNYKSKRAIPSNYIQLENQLVNARKIFVPKPYSGAITLFRAATQPYGLAPDPTLGWDRYVPELRITEIPGHHTSIIAEPYVGRLAQELSRVLSTPDSFAMAASTAGPAVSNSTLDDLRTLKEVVS